jgi:hypothetical protein
MKYVDEYLGMLDKAAGKSFIEVRPEVQQRYNAAIQARLKRTIPASGCRSWYLDRNGRNVALYPGLSWQYERVIKRLRALDYELRPVHHIKADVPASAEG